MISGSLEPNACSSGGSLLAFFALAFALMWICFFTVALVPIAASSTLGGGLILLGAFAPAFAALMVTSMAEGRPGVVALLRGVTRWRVSPKYYAFALAYIAAIKLSAATIYRLTTGTWPRLGDSPLYIIPIAIAFSTPFQAGEEIGWRGYALPQLTARIGLRGASLLLGLIWGVWHLPQFFIRGGDTYQQSLPVFVLQVCAISVAFAWLYARTGRSLLLTMLLHSAINNSKDIVPSGVLGGAHTFKFFAPRLSWISLGLLWVCAAYFLYVMRRAVLLADMPSTKEPGSSKAQGGAMPERE
jgi:uncharacterized protein